MTRSVCAENPTFARPCALPLSSLADGTKWLTICKVMRWKVRRSSTLIKGRERYVDPSWLIKSNYKALNTNTGRQMRNVDKKRLGIETIRDRESKMA